MPKLSDETVTLIPHVAVLYRRDAGEIWQVRYKANGKWLRTSTKTRELAEAKTIATDIALEARYKQRLGMPVQTKRFASIAQAAITRMRDAGKEGTGKVVYSHYIAALENYLIPFFGKHNVTSIDRTQLQQFNVWRLEQMKRAPKASTINTHNAALGRVFDLALELGYMNNSQVPALINKARDGDRRPDFSVEEFIYLQNFMPGWVERARTPKSKQMRELLRDYVLILANTGMRHGTESYGLKWQHIAETYDEAERKRFMTIYVDGKTGPRELVARDNCVHYFRSIHARDEKLKSLTWDRLLAARRDELVFRLADGTVTKSLNQTFEALLTEANILKDQRTGQNRTLYSLRHTYATLNLVNAHVDIHTLAKQMGTSALMIERHYSHLIPRQRASELSKPLDIMSPVDKQGRRRRTDFDG